MPRPNRKKKNTPTIVYTKRQEIQDDDGWTHVVDTPRKRRSTLTKAANGGLHTGDFEIDGVGYVNRTLEEMSKEYDFWKKSWEGEAACGQLVEVLGQVKESSSQNGPDDAQHTQDKLAQDGEVLSHKPADIASNGKRVKVDSIVVLGLGSLQSARREGRRATMTQLAALQTIVQQLDDTAPSLKIILQEPQFTPLDIEYLQSFPNYEVVSDPDAFGRITTGTLVYAVHCYSQVYKAVGEGARPAVIVGTDMGNFGRFNTSEDAANTQKSLEALVQNCEVFEFPQVRHDFSDTKIYWRRVI